MGRGADDTNAAEGVGYDVTPGAGHMDDNYMDIHLIKSNQHSSGAYPASPTYSQYPHCWLRDGSFIAHAMDLAGEGESAAAFHAWVARTISSHSSEIRELLERGQRGEAVQEHEFLPARFTVEGRWEQDGWPNFQLDGYGHWLWSLGEHLRRTGRGEVSADLREAARLVVDYLATFWQEPCYDAWEEYRSQLHTATLASIYGGLTSIGGSLFPHALDLASAVRKVILDECVEEGRFVKHIANPAVDSSLLWLSAPFELVPVDHPVLAATVAEIEGKLSVTGGVKRYVADTFYGGGEWILLTAWLGWHYVRQGKYERARECLAWIESHRDESGFLPEQVSHEKINERFLHFWSGRWGPPASPLLWSHAMTLVLRLELTMAED